MIDSPQDEPEDDRSAPSVSGGVNASAEGGQVSVGGDVTGRDKTVSAGTYVERVEMHVHGGGSERSPDDVAQPPSARAGHYLDFEVEIGRGLGRDYPLAVIRSPAGEARETLHFPFDELALEHQLSALQIALLRSGGARRQVLSPEEKTVQGFGRALFDALLSGEARSRFDMSWAAARQRGRGLRLKLRIQPPELARLPWEFLYDPRQAEYVCLSRDTPVVRYLELPQPIQPLTVTPPLRVLGMVASPRDLPALNVDREKQRLEAAIADLRASKLIELTWLQGQTWRDLQRAMRGGPWHIFHFIGHGGFDQNADEGLVALTDDHGFTHRLMATELGRLLADHHSLRLALLNSCEGARGSQHDIFSSTASILVRRGLPAVLAMQYEITDRAAIEFSRAFYEALADGLPVDAAVAEARKAVSLAVTNTVEWGTPVLYMRAPQGVIFEMPESRRVRRPIEPFADADKELKQKLEQLYTDGLSAFWIEEWDKACRSFQAIVDARPDYPGAAAKLEEAQRQKRLSALYETAQKAQDDGNWHSAQSALEKLVAESADYKDAAATLRLVKKQKQLADLYAEAQRLHAAQQWQAVVNVFAQIHALEPEYADPDELLSKAEKEVAALKRQAELDELYARAVREMDAGRWQAARLLLEKLQEAEPGFRDAERLLAKVQAEIAREAEERQRQEQVATLYEQAQGLTRAKQWRQALAKMEEIHGLSPDFADADGIAARARKEVAKEEEEAQRQTELAALYAEAVRLLRAGQYQEALDKWAEVQTRDPKYRDRHKVQRTARQKLAAQAETAPARRPLDRRRTAIGGGLLVLAILTVALWLSGLFPVLVATPTPTVQVAPARTFTTSDDFHAAIRTLDTPTVIGFEDIDARPVNNTYAGRKPFDGATYATRGIVFASTHGLPLYIAPGGLDWNASNSLSVYQFPYDTSGEQDQAEDDLTLVLSPAVVAVGFDLIDYDGNEGSVQFIDAASAVVKEIALRQPRSFVGIVSIDRPIASVRIEDGPPDDSDDVNFDNFVFVPASGVADPTVYDNFNDPSNDGSYNKSLWEIAEISSAAEVSQRNGVIALTADTPDEHTHLTARKYAYLLQSSAFFEADLRLDPDRDAGAVLMGPCCGYLDTNCTLSKADNTHHTATCWINKEGPTNLATLPAGGLKVTAGSWHTFRVEFNRATRTFTFFIDGQRVGSKTISDADLRGTRPTFALRVVRDEVGSTAATGYFDNVRIGPLE